ncbi:MAG TPA: amidohydrolase family protein [Gemmatimonadaceae bacterium]|nr:amidohydrolase family protein [Gemmatimonadaceae bacterium]
MVHAHGMIVSLLVAAGATTLAKTDAFAQTARPLGIGHVTVIDVERGTRLRDQTIIVEGGLISTVGPSSQVRVPDGYAYIDARGKFVIPGLVDVRLLARGDSSAVSKVTPPSLERDLLRGVLTVVQPAQGAVNVRGAGRDAVLPRVLAAGERRDAGRRLAGADSAADVLERIRALGASGLTPTAALRAVTYDAARWAGVEDRVGVVAPGRFADFLILRANPLDAIANVMMIDAIVVQGRVIDGEERNARLGRARQVSR